MTTMTMDDVQVNTIYTRFNTYNTMITAEAELANNNDGSYAAELHNLGVILQELKPQDQNTFLISEVPATRLDLEKVRRALFNIMAVEHQSRLGAEFFQFVFEMQIALAKSNPTNKEKGHDEQGQMTYEDPLQLEDDFKYNEEEIVATSSGWLYCKSGLTEYFSRNNAFTFVDGVPHLRTPFGEVLSEREITNLRANGVRIPRPDVGILRLNHAFGLGGQRINGNAANGQGNANDIDQMLPAVERFISVIHVSMSTLYGFLGGALLGSIAGSVLTIALVLMAPPMSPIGLLVFFGTAISAGLLAAKRENSPGQFSEILHALCTNLFIMSVTALAAPYVIAGLGAISVLSAAAMATAYAALPIIIEASLGVAFILGAITELFKNDGMAKFYETVYKVPSQIGLVVGGLAGAILGATYGLIKNIFRRPIDVSMLRAELAGNQNQDINNEIDFFHGNEPQPQPQAGLNNQAGIINQLNIQPAVVADNLQQNGGDNNAQHQDSGHNDNTFSSDHSTHQDFEAPGPKTTDEELLKSLGLDDTEPFDFSETSNQSKGISIKAGSL